MSFEENDRIEKNLKQLIQFCSDTLERLESNFCSDVQAKVFVYDLFFDQVGTDVRKFDDSISKFAGYFKDPTKGKECLDSLELLSTSLASLFGSVESIQPANAGYFFHLEVKRVSKSFLECLKGYFIILTNENIPQRRTQMALVRRISESCWAMTEVSSNDAIAGAKAIKTSLRLIVDVISELDDENILESYEEHLTEDESNQLHSTHNSPSSVSDDLRIIRSCKDFLDSCVDILTKSISLNIENEKCTSLESIQWIDMFCKEALKLESLIDSFGASLFPPINGPIAVALSVEIYTVLETLINLLKLELEEFQIAWIREYPEVLKQKLVLITNKFPER